MDRNQQKIGLVNWLLLLVGSVVGIILARYANSAAGWVTAGVMALGFLIAFLGYVQMRLEERERLEKLEFDELNKAKGSSALFSGEADSFAARRSREQFERFVIPAFTFLVLAAEMTGLFFGWKRFATDPALNRAGAMIGVAVFGLLFLILFLLGKYSAGLVRLQKQRLLQPAAGFLLLSAYTCLLAGGGMLLVEAGFAKADVYVARGLLGLVGLIALETLFKLVFEAYRPRVRGRVGRLLYDSRLVGVLSEPESVFLTAAHALDYQFGFNVSDTWAVREMRSHARWFIPGLILLPLVGTSFVFIGAGEQGLLERFGKPILGREVLEPGVHLKWPWPIDAAQVFKSREIQSFNVGAVPDPDREKEVVILWNVAHYKEEFNLLVATRSESTGTNADGFVPVNLLTVSIPVQYQIGDVRKFAYNYSDSGGLLEKIANREVVKYLVGIDLNEIMTTGRGRAASELLTRIQDRANELQLGVKIVFVGLQDIHPPVKVADAYQAVIGAEQLFQSKILRAEGYASSTVLLAEAEAQKKIRDAEAYKFSTLADAVARSAQFTNQILAFDASRRYYPQRLYLQTFARATAGARKYLIAATNTSDVIQLNLEDKIRTDLLDVTVPTGSK